MTAAGRRRPFEVFVFVRRGGEYLVLHRSPAGGAYWHGVAGAVEEGESYAQAAARELAEETGLVAEAVEVAAPYTYPLHEFPEYRASLPPEAREIVVQSFLVEAPSRWEPRLDHEHDDYRWCGREEALRLLHWPEPRAILRSLE